MAMGDSDALKSMLLEIRQEIGSLRQEVFQRVTDLESIVHRSGNTAPLDDHADSIGSFRPKPQEFPRYDGSTDPAEWKFKAARFFHHHKTPEGHKLSTACYYLEGEALEWYWHITATRDSLTWSEFLAALDSRFGSVSFLDAHGSLSKLKQTGSVLEYQRLFEKLCNKISGVPEEHLLGTYLSGLKEELSCEVRSFQPRTLTHAMELARIQETKLLSRRRYTGQSSSLPPLLPTPSVHHNPPIRRLTSQQLQERKSKGLCFNCDEKWTLGHTCQAKKLFLLQLIPMSDDYDLVQTEVTMEEDTEFCQLENNIPSISSQIVGNMATPGTMRILGTISGVTVIILVDNGSTHNFIDPSIVKKLHLRTIPCENPAVRLASGLQVPSEGLCPNVKLQLPEVSFDLDFLVLPLGGIDVVLGATWLQLLGDIVLNIREMTMTFAWLGKQYKFTGLTDDKVNMISGPKLHKELRNARALYTI